jgi:hypothetical protein
MIYISIVRIGTLKVVKFRLCVSKYSHSDVLWECEVLSYVKIATFIVRALILLVLVPEQNDSNSKNPVTI